MSKVVSGSNLHGDPVFDAFAASCQAQFNAAIGAEGSRTPLLCTEVDEEQIYQIYLQNVPEDERQYHTCSCCKTFIRRYGNLVTVNDDGTVTSAIWNPLTVPEMYRNAAQALKDYVEERRVNDAHISSEPVYGSPVTGPWTHFAIRPPRDIIFRRRGLNNASQAVAEKREDVRVLNEALGAWSPETIKTALGLLEAGTLPRSERVIDPVRFLLRLQEVRSKVKKRNGDWGNLVWLGSVKFPSNFSKPRAGAVGALLDDIQAGTPIPDVSRKFAAIMHPLAYQRPQAAPRAGNIAQAEKLIKELGMERSLMRRYARLEELQTVWSPRSSGRTEASGGVFSGVQSRQDPKGILRRAVNLPPQKITWVRFARDVMPTAIDMSVLVTPTMNLGAFVTAVDMDAPRIIQWDEEDNRNPFSMYVYHPSSPAERWSLTAPGEARVTGISLHPSKWNGYEAYPHIGKCVAFILEGARDATRRNSLALFPEILQSSLHSVRATIEAYSKTAALQGNDQATACGLFVAGGTFHPHNIRVTTPNGSVNYTIDRWE